MPGTGEVWITGIGLVSSLGEGVEAHWRAGTASPAAPRIDEQRFSPYAVHPLAAVEFTKHIPKTSDQRQMERWQRVGVYTAGLALADAGVLGDTQLLSGIDLSIAAGNGERDLDLDSRILAQLDADPIDPGMLNRQLATGLRPTLYLGQLSNLLAGNISIVLKATGSSRTFKGEEMAGTAALEDAFRRLASGTSQIALVGGALNAEREDILLNMELCGALHRGPYASVKERQTTGGGMCLGSVGAFVVVERRDHAEARGARPYAAIRAVACDRPDAAAGKAASAAKTLFHHAVRPSIGAAPFAVLSGASGVAPAFDEEGAFLDHLTLQGRHPVVRTYGSLLGHGLETHFITGTALAAVALSRGQFYAPFRGDLDAGGPEGPSADILVTGFGHWQGVGLALLGAVEGGRT